MSTTDEAAATVQAAVETLRQDGRRAPALQLHRAQRRAEKAAALVAALDARILLRGEPTSAQARRRTALAQHAGAAATARTELLRRLQDAIIPTRAGARATPPRSRLRADGAPDGRYRDSPNGRWRGQRGTLLAAALSAWRREWTAALAHGAQPPEAAMRAGVMAAAAVESAPLDQLSDTEILS